DKNEEVWLFDVAGKKDVRIMKTEEGGPDGLAWSPDSKWLAYSRSAKNSFDVIALYSVDRESTTVITSDRVDSDNPAWSPDGHWLYFIADRVFQSVVSSPWGARQPEPYFDKTSKICALALTKDGRFPFLPADEVAALKEGQKRAEAKDDKTEDRKEAGKPQEKKPPAVTIDFDGLLSRLYEVPIPAGAYSSLAVTDKYLYAVERPSRYQGKAALVALEIKNRDVSAKTVLEDIRSYDLSSDRKKIAVLKGDDLYVIDADGKAPAELPKAKVDLSGWLLTVNPRDEFRQMFVEAWRLERDYFYDPHLHGVDYKGLLDRHIALLDRVTDRDEFGDLVGDLVGELSALHTFVYGGDVRRAQDRINLASLGALLRRDDAAGGYRIERIYRADPNLSDVVSPLARPGLTIREGDVILTINGTSVLSVDSPDRLLENTAGQQVLLHIRGEGGAYDAVVKPLSAAEDRNLRYGEWEETCRQTVERKGGGDIGYVHLRAMGGGNYGEWVRGFYPVFDRKGLIIDMRNNQGGNIDSWILEKLMRKAWFYWQDRVGKPYWNMQYAFRGHMVVLCNEWTASDGEAFTEGFRRLGLGKVLGTRTWGGEIWLSSSNVLVDKGIATAAEDGVFGPEGDWLIEGHGVDPDTIVDNLPHATFTGQDAQLDAAIRYLQEEILVHPVEPPKPPKYPDKSFRY
ncbi:MAG TPA: S41 family peptidase, partial [Bacteroidota bacterium]|nr:S41 family peptidase [Bacteroidota bacterium]